VRRESTDIHPVKPNTIAKSLAIGNPADGYYAAGFILKTGGAADDVTDQEIREGIQLLAQHEGIYTETAGGVSVAVTRKLVERGRIDRRGLTVIAITGNGLKTPEAVELAAPEVIDAKIDAFERLMKGVAHVA
jgi:threonine synthase